MKIANYAIPGTMRIEDGMVKVEYEKFTRNTFAKATGVSKATVAFWEIQGKLDLSKPPYQVILDFWNMKTECAACGKRTNPGIGIERWCPHCGEARLKIGITYYTDQNHGHDSNDGVTPDTAFETSSKAMCRARDKHDRIFTKTYRKE